MAAKPLTIKTVVTLNAAASTANGTDYEIQQIVLATFNRDSSVGFGRIGAGVYANKLYAVITEQLPSIQIKDISVAPSGGSAVNFVQAGIDQIPVCSLSDISVVRA